MYEWKINFSKDSVKIFKKIQSPLDKQFKDKEIEEIGYNDLIKFNNLNIVVTKIEPEIDKGILKSLIFYASEFKFIESFQTNQETTNVSNELKLIIIGKEKIPWRVYRDLLVEPALWLFKNNRLQKKDMPVYDVSHGKRYLLNFVPKHSYDREFDSFEPISEGIYLHTNYSSDGCKRNGEYLMRKFAPDIEFKILGF